MVEIIGLLTRKQHLDSTQQHIIGLQSKVGVTGALCQMKNAQLYFSVNALDYHFVCD